MDPMDDRTGRYEPSALVPSRRAETLPDDVVTRRKELMLRYLAEGWSIRHACERAGCTPPTLALYRKDDPAFDDQCLEAIEMGTDALEDTALMRARFGTDKPVFYQGEECGTIREYSDTLLIFLLKARRPEKFSERIRNTLENPDGSAVAFTFNTGGAAPEKIMEARSRDAVEADVIEGAIDITPKLP